MIVTCILKSFNAINAFVTAVEDFKALTMFNMVQSFKCVKRLLQVLKKLVIARPGEPAAAAAEHL